MFFPLFFFSFLHVCSSRCWLCLSVCVITRSQQPGACLPQPSLNSLTFSLPCLFLFPLSVSQDEGPQHLISTSAVKVQRLLVLLHIMKEGWSLDPPGKAAERLGDWKKNPRVVFYCFFLPLSSQMPLFSLFCFGVCGKRFFAETNFLLLFFRHNEKKTL